MYEDTLKNARLLIVDDQETNVSLLERLLQRAGYVAVKSTTDPRHVLPLFTEFRPDIILLDLNMPHLDGFAVMRQLLPRIEGTYLPILVLTADSTTETKQKALAAGAKDFLTKPFDTTEVRLRIRNLLETRFLYLEIQNQNQMLEQKVQERTHDLEEARIEILNRLALAAEFRDDDTNQHTQRVARTAMLIARELSLPEPEVELIRRAAPLHDVGKIGIPDAILLKPARFSPAEREVMNTHTTIGAQILSGSRFPLLQLAEEIALTHHERWDGRGYTGLAGEAIPLTGQIVAVADVFDALTHARPYKEAWPLAASVAEIRNNSGTQFAPRVVQAFMALFERGEL
ncbi:MAG: response regulator [Chloroflexi bacterium]|nr:response regulator [Chloroflexota bacterium]